jgi:N-acetylneuraminic acid mutarotase
MNSNNNNVENNNIQSNWNQHVTTLTTKRKDHAAVAMDEHRILITGGYDDNRVILKSVEILNTTNETTTTVADMNERRFGHQSIEYKNDVFVIGGTGNNSGPLNKVEKININNFSSGWTQMPTMNEKRSSFAAALHDKYIYVFGGHNGRTELSSIERFDIPNNKWDVLNSKMNMKRNGHAAVTVGDKIYIIGGEDENGNNLNSMDIFDISSNTFQQENIPNIPIALTYMSAIAIGKWIVVTGGSNNENVYIAESYVYDTEQNEWKDDINCSKLSVARDTHTATVLGGDTIYICGGSGVEDNNNNTLDSIEYISFKDLTGISINGMC